MVFFDLQMGVYDAESGLLLFWWAKMMGFAAKKQ